MYSGVSSATHHIFFPPRLQVVGLQEDSDRLASHPRYQSSFHRLLRHQAHRPSRGPERGFATDHCDDALFLRGGQHLGRPRPWFLEQRGGQAAPAIPLRDVANGLRRQAHELRDGGWALSTMEMQQRQGPQYYPHLLHAAVQHGVQLLHVLRLQSERQGRSWHPGTYGTPLLWVNI